MSGALPEIAPVSRYRGCLLGGAVGDALGAPIEFMSRAAIRQRYGFRGLTDYVPAYGRLGAITDDTQMTLFTAEGILRGVVRHSLRGMASPEGMVKKAYGRWLYTQGETTDSEQKQLQSGWLVTHPELFQRRAPGNTCLDALRVSPGGVDPANNDSKGCGGVMRMAPVGLYFAARRGDGVRAEAFDWGCRFAALTHGHPSGILPAGVFALLVGELASGGTLEAALNAAFPLLVKQPSHEETLTALLLARELAAAGTDRDSAIDRLGEGWVAEEALGISVYCALVAKDFEDGVVLAVNHGGDSDSTGAMVGNLLGAALGVEAIPDRWRDRLELREVIVQVADDLLDVATDGYDEGRNPPFDRRYPGW